MASAGFRQLITLAWPIVLARSAQSVIGFSDAAMVAPLGDDALTAATGGALNTFGALSLVLGTAYIVQSFAAQLAGRDDLAGARRYLRYGLLLAALTLVLALAASPFIPAALGLTSYTPVVRDLMTEYMVIRMLSAGFVIASEVLGNWFAGLGDTTVAMRASVVAMVVNVALNWVLIHGNLGAPALGVAGAAWASVIASLAGLGVAAAAYMRDRGRGAMLRLAAARAAGEAPAPEHEVSVPEDIHDDRLRLREFGRMLRFGLPNGFNMFLEFSAFLVFINFIFADLGTVPVAALLAVIQVNSVSFMPAFGLASAGAVLVGQAIGAGRHDDVPAIVRRTFAAAAVWQGMVGLIYFLIPAQLMSVFARDPALAAEGVSSEAVATVGATLLAISAAWQLLDAVAMTTSEALRAAGDTAWTLWARIVLAWVVWIPLALAVVYWFEGGAVGATWCVVVYMIALAAAFALRFRSGVWRRIDLTGARG